MIKPSEIERIKERVESEGRYSSESIRISREAFDLRELNCLAEHSRALANDTLYLLRQYYFFHNTKNLEKKNLYHKNIIDKYYKTIIKSQYSNEKKERAIEILDDLFVKLKSLKSTVPTIMKFMESYKDIGYTGCAQQIVISVCNTFISHLTLIRKYYRNLKSWNQTPENQRGPKPSRPGLPRYFGKKIKGERQGKWKLIYTKQGLKNQNNLESLTNALNNNRYTCSMYVPPSHDHLIPPIRVRTKILRQLFENGGFVEIIPKKSSNSFYIHYIKTKTQRAGEYGLILERYQQDPNRAISIDFGVNNFLTVFNNFGARFPIFKGSAIKRWNYKINHTIPKLQRRVDILTDVIERYDFEKDSGSIRSLESILTSRIHTYRDEFKKLKRMILYIFRKGSALSSLDIHDLSDRDIILKCLQSGSFYRTMKNINWDGFKKIAENDGEAIFRGIFNSIRTIILNDLRPRVKKNIFIKYFSYIKSKHKHKIRILNQISNYSVRRLRGLLMLFERKIDELWDKYNRVKRDAINKIAKELMYYCLYYRVGTITIGYNKGWQNQRFRKIKLRKLTRGLFVSLPFNQMFERIQQEAVYFGINVDYTSEWYTSKCSYIDEEAIQKKADGEYAGQRRLINNGINHNGLFRSRSGHIIHGDINGAANIGKRKHPKLFSKKMIAYNLGLISDPRRPLYDRIKRMVSEFIITPPIKFSPSNGISTKELKREERLNKSKIKPQKVSNES